MLTTNFLDFDFDNPFMNASGVHCMTTSELDELAVSNAGAYIMKSATPEKRDGNPAPRYFDVPLGSINSMGLPNLGFKYYLEYALQQQERTERPLFFSVAGMSVAENIAMLKEIEASDFKGVTELNLSCPNVPGKPQVAYDFELTDKTLSRIFEFFTKPLGVKLPPYFDMAHFDQMAAILNKYPLTYVNSINSIGNGLYIDPTSDQVVIKPKDGFGGIGGEYVKPTALANVRAFYTRLKPEIKIIGTGGIITGQDAYEHLLCGATMLQVGTQLQKEGPMIFDRLQEELTAIMKAKGYKTIADFRGQLKTIA
ncbi:dihydroorotate oxidase [Enterococcus dispar]|uniref:Dihydroorotate dehydrogenase n=2 Tax=Enterococcus TaxID=1350 RepID=S0KND7_9ENTE|nr:dihydroorotate oxidase [Enterococcus dispar]EOT42525.1 dihydroorotate dehydrogenase A [Enterococcus dispar ATCC 51266]EOW85024.1 dihydroorotate dehydrogenase A [Enterococcus dispar ATCC 51266]MCU7356069.1 dihydroorotate oxidase [Enterococcus dispar]MDT2704879.1 dihydroorotate oxidase [Enterococcus dispar]OJG37819.1 dihydroorotate dehydrogenase A [Enterococcus dispar]